MPYVNVALLNNYLNQMSTTVLGLYNVMSGGAFAQATIFALSIQPYINSQIIIQLLTIAIPALERLQKDGGEEGKKKIQSITRYATVGIAVLQGFGYYMLMKKYNLLSVTDPSIWHALVIIISFVAGSSFVMLASGAKVYDEDVSTTPSISFLCLSQHFDYGIMKMEVL